MEARRFGHVQAPCIGSYYLHLASKARDISNHTPSFYLVNNCERSTDFFYRATLCVSGSLLSPGVCRLSHWCIVSRRLKIPSNSFSVQYPYPSSFDLWRRAGTKFLAEPLSGGAKYTGVRKFCDF